MFLPPSERPSHVYTRTLKPNLPAPSYQLTSLKVVTHTLAQTLLQGTTLRVRLDPSGNFWETTLSRRTDNRAEKPKVSSPFQEEFKIPFKAPLFELLRSTLIETQHLLGLRVNSPSESSFALSAIRIHPLFPSSS